MKVAATIIETGKGWECLECGTNLAEQKGAVKALLDSFGSGPVRVQVLYSNGRPATRKSIALKGDIGKAWEAAKVAAGKEVAKREAVNAEIAKAQQSAKVRKAKKAPAKEKEGA